ncbi:alanine:cation symporter family protein [Treponema ruminis]|uniref:AGCS family alanine or glycine:cation symporter n=1 Tax=Treponema ruminis TaxID=744515 RepID=A0A7W8GAM2_9SPIR|nr:alanine/glycine:cation symporter family protein [Treponema ruminis]MBB5226825.1 AGCS family alanine or glycine:cation symporter [Treponema ruminis]QSI01256.1 alanine:cation symporter family protein [Treponema ruminis]
MFSTINNILNTIDDVVWGIPTIALILITGIVVTVSTRGIQFTKLGRAFKSIFKENEGHGELSGFAALCTALSATIGTGNIVGVSTAVLAGGPGALFWMWLAAILGTATKYAECMLAIKYREVASDGHILGGPFYTIEKGMGPKWKWLAVLFAIFGTLVGLLGIGTFTQINGICGAIQNAFDPENANIAFYIGEHAYSWATVIGGAIITVSAALVIIGGLKRIAKVAEKVVPAMAFIYIFLGLAVLIMNATKIPAAFELIFKGAFGAQTGLKALEGAALGVVLKTAMQKGIARGIFSNEAGLGSAPIAAAAVQTNEPVEQGMVNMTGTVIDTLIICTMTGLSIIIAGGDVWNSGASGAALTAKAFSTILGGDGKSIQFLLMLCLIFFAFTTILGWDYYSERCLEYLSKGNQTVVKAYRWLYIIAVAIGPYMTISAVWTIADITNGLMAIPNCISLIVLSGVIAKETESYFNKYPKL